MTKIDPSATVGFYCKTRADFDRFVEHTEEVCWSFTVLHISVYRIERNNRKGNKDSKTEEFH